jgi:hypothetical protein
VRHVGRQHGVLPVLRVVLYFVVRQRQDELFVGFTRAAYVGRQRSVVLDASAQLLRRMTALELLAPRTDGWLRRMYFETGHLRDDFLDAWVPGRGRVQEVTSGCLLEAKHEKQARSIGPLWRSPTGGSGSQAGVDRHPVAGRCLSEAADRLCFRRRLAVGLRHTMARTDRLVLGAAEHSHFQCLCGGSPTHDQRKHGPVEVQSSRGAGRRRLPLRHTPTARLSGRAQPMRCDRVWTASTSRSAAAAHRCVPSAAGFPTGDCRGCPTGSFKAARSGQRMSAMGRNAKLCIATPMHSTQLCVVAPRPARPTTRSTTASRRGALSIVTGSAGTSSGRRRRGIAGA